MHSKVTTSTHEKFILSAKNGKILANRCKGCKNIMLETIYYCTNCGKNEFDTTELDGTGTVVTYTIQTVAPEGFEDIESYAWVIFKLDNAHIRSSGFLPGIRDPSDLPIGSKVKVSGYDMKHGLYLEKAL